MCALPTQISSKSCFFGLILYYGGAVRLRLRIRTRLKAAAAKVKKQSAFSSPRYFIFRIPPTVFIQPKISSTRLVALMPPTATIYRRVLLLCYMRRYLQTSQFFNKVTTNSLPPHDPRSLGSMFYACVDEVKDLSILEALQRIMQLALDKVRQSGEFAEDVIMKLLDAIMTTAIAMLKPPQYGVAENNV